MVLTDGAQHCILLPTHSLPARSTNCSLVLMGGCVMLGRGEGHGEWQGEWHGEEAGLEEREEADLRQRGLHHSFWDTRWTSCLAFCRRRAATHRNYTFIKLHLLTFGAGLQRPYFALWFVPFHLFYRIIHLLPICLWCYTPESNGNL